MTDQNPSPENINTDAFVGATIGAKGSSKGKKVKNVLGSSQTDPNKILPITYKWAREYYKKGVANNWVPEEVSMQRDIELWKSSDGLTSDERRMVLWNLGFFSTAESLTANNIVLTIYKHVTNPECRQYLLRQGFEEAIHTDTFIYCCDSLSLDPEEIYNMYLTIPSIEDKDRFVVSITQSLLDPNFRITDEKSIQKFVFDLVGYYVIMEGIFFYAGFAMMLSMLRNNKMIGVGEQFQYILRDESVHLAFGVDLINTIKEENPDIWTDEFKKSLSENIQKAVELEKSYANDSLPRGILGLRPDIVSEYVEHIADRRLESIGLDKIYNSANPFPWMSEVIDLSKEKNFFESRVNEYQQGGSLGW
ncbi:ribonucleotide-diphosphate reductase subunit beta [Candidatus Gracilibacteria bacterium]|nr:ribonucleotide-diphosphate reductase subunit beta [Candidatus Gracilibacteria bacterium]